MTEAYFEGNTEKNYYVHMVSLEQELRQLRSWADEAETTIAIQQEEIAKLEAALREAKTSTPEATDMLPLEKRVSMRHLLKDIING